MTDIPTRLVDAAARVLADRLNAATGKRQPVDSWDRDVAAAMLAAVFAECEVREEVRASLRWLVITTPPWEGDGE